MLPIVSTSYGTEGLPEIAGIVPSCDTPESFAERLKIFINNDDECERAVGNYKTWLKRFFSKKRWRHCIA